MASLEFCKNLTNFLGTDIVTLIVGKEKKKFTIHKDPLCKASHFFERAFNSGFKEAIEGVMTLPQDLPIHVKMLIESIYGGPLWRLNLHEMWVGTGDRPPALAIDDLLSLYIFAEKCLCLRLQNTVVDAIQDMAAIGDYDITICTPEGLAASFEATSHSQTSGLTKLCAATLVWLVAHDEEWTAQATSEIFRKTSSDLLPYLEHQQRIRDGEIKESEDQHTRGHGSYFTCFFHNHDEDITEEACHSVSTLTVDSEFIAAEHADS